MGESIIQVENLSKRYMISHQGNKGDGLRHRIEELARSPVRWLRGALKNASNNGSGASPSPEKASKATKEEFWALKDVSFEIKQGEVVGIIGRNGAGKSTLLKLLSRITEPTTGRITICGRVASLLEVGTGFHPELTGRENIFLNGAILGMSKVEINKRFDEIVAFAEIEQFLDTPVKRYSSGMYVRLAFAVAAHLEPEILIVDEVLAVGDAEFQKKCIGRMDEVSKSGRTVFFVSHNMASITHFCTRAIWLERGTVRGADASKAIVEEYLSTASADNQKRVVRGVGNPQKPQIESAAILDCSGKDRNTFALGEDLVVELVFRCPTGQPLKTPVMGVVLSHAAFGTVGGVNTRMAGYSVPPGAYWRGTYRCKLTGLPLLQGRYSVDVWLGDGLADLDSVRSACGFTLEDGDVYGTGKPPFAHMGVIFLQPEWDFAAA